MLEWEYNEAGDTMRKKFKGKPNAKKILYPFFLFIVLIILYLLGSFLLSNITLFSNDEKFIHYLLEDANHYLVYDKKNNYYQDFFLNIVLKIDLNNPLTVLNQSSYYLKEPQKTILVYNENYSNEVPVIKEESNLPLVYIYNTHPTETFIDDELSAHNIEPTIHSMADVLKEKLEEIGVPTIVEEGDVTKFLKENNYNYNQSYKASRYYLEQFLKKNSSVKLYIDLHRDGVDYDVSVTTINDEKYAKIMFVVGGASSNYQSTLETSKKINTYFQKNYPSLTRGIFERKGSHFNQDVVQNTILIELGGNYNKITEVLNTIDILALAIKEYVYDY